LQELPSREVVNGSEDGVQSEKLKEDYSESSTPEASLKRRISEVSDAEIQPPRQHQQPPSPPIPTYSSESNYPPVLHSSLNHLFPSPPPKRRPDPNEDTIGSDLDDSEEEGDIDSEDDDDNMPLMLCLYEKVHRTKNKWRATMNHGIVCIEGKEWVFERGNGEYEW
jgi:transcription initiation factor TFIIA large subunit